MIVPTLAQSPRCQVNAHLLREHRTMPHTALERFPHFAGAAIPQLSVLSITHPSLERARALPRFYLESCPARLLRSGGAEERIVQHNRMGKILAAYADSRPSEIYPRLNARIELELAPVPGGWKLKAHARHGSQESMGGSFEFSGYCEAFGHARAWISYAEAWIGESWVRVSDQAFPKGKIEIVAPTIFSSVAGTRLDSSPLLQGALESQFAERLFRLLIEQEIIKEDSNVLR